VECFTLIKYTSALKPVLLDAMFFCRKHLYTPCILVIPKIIAECSLAMISGGIIFTLDRFYIIGENLANMPL
jgi:hypothetical protein